MLAAAIVVLAAAYLVGLALVSFFAPVQAARFLNAFAASLRAHLLEMSLRLLAGLAFIRFGPQMVFPGGFVMFGWLLVVTSVVLLLLPWRWHQRFARRSVAPMTRRPWVFGLVALPLGAAILYAALG